MANIAVIVGGGKGIRMDEKVNKILLSLAGKPLIYHSIKRFDEHPEIDSIILVTNKNDTNEIKKIINQYDFKKIKKITEGGEKRQDSVFNGLKAIENAKDEDVILIHNAANPFVSEETISRIIKETKEHGAAVAAVKAKDTIKEVEDSFVGKTLDRGKLWHMQTPQSMRYGLAMKAFEKAYKDGFYATDDVALVERIGEKVKVVETNKENIKVTTPEDLELAEKIESCARVGIGQDSHRFEEKEKPLVLGGAVIQGENGLEANSDGDVILHSLFNALSQSIGEKSLGYYADPMCKEGITDSKEYIKLILGKLRDFKINNVGIMVEAKRPKLELHHDKIKESLSELLKINNEQIGLTFTSGEELTSFGQGKGIQVFSVVLLGK